MKLDKKILLSTLWIFAVLNYLYADVLGFYKPGMFKEIAAMGMTPGLLLAGAILMETAIVMVLLSRILKRKANRIANITAGVIHTLAVSSSMFVGSLDLYYAFFASIEIITTISIITIAWKWKK